MVLDTKIDYAVWNIVLVWGTLPINARLWSSWNKVAIISASENLR